MLHEIIENKKKEIEITKKRFPLYSFSYKIKKSTRDFRKAISKGKLNLIAEFKRKSPSKNMPNKNFDLNQIINSYNKYADAVSILTDKKFFDGTIDDLRQASKLTNLPLLRKDFIIDEYQIYESRFYGADAILLIASILSKEQIDYFIDIATKYNMYCIAEIHSEEELGKVLQTKAQIIGINNRDLKTLKIDLNTTLSIFDKIPLNRIIVSESGISDRSYVEKIKGKVNAILVGSVFMESDGVEKKIVSLLK